MINSFQDRGLFKGTKNSKLPVRSSKVPGHNSKFVASDYLGVRLFQTSWK